MIRKFIYYLILTAVVFSCVTVQVPAFADEATEDYTDITHSLSNEQRNSLSDYLCRFGACYTTDFEGENGGKIVLVLVIGLKRCLRIFGGSFWLTASATAKP